MAILPQDVHAALSQYMLVDGYKFVVDLHKSHGSILVDAANGKEYIDFYSYFASSPLGHNHPALANNSRFKDDILSAAIDKPANSDVYTTYMAEFIQTFMNIAAPSYLKNIFLIDGGTLAVENALKAAFDWKMRLNMSKNITVHENDLKIIHFNQAFHGRSGYALSITNTFDPKKTMYFPKFNWPRLPNPKLYFPLTQQYLEQLIIQEHDIEQSIEDICTENEHEIAGLIIEPIQGEGGDNHFRKEFLQSLERVSKKYNFLFILDEVQTGLGMCGKMWAHQWFDIRPDIIAFGKKTQVCGILAGDRIHEVKDNVFTLSSRINSTWGGNLVDMVRATHILLTIQKDNLVQNALKCGMYMLNKLEFIQSNYTHLVTNVRGKGLFIAFDLPSHELRNVFVKKLFDEHVLVLGCGERSIRFRPSLTLATATVDEGISRIEKVLQKMI